jgi:cell division protease FtsH
MAGGYTKVLEEDRTIYTRSLLKDMLAFLLAGHAAEDLIFNERTSGPHSDIKQATTWARRMVIDLGMSDKLGPRTFGDKQELVFLGREISEQRDYSERFALEIDREVNKLIDEGYSTAKKILSENKDKLVKIATILLEKETLEGDELEKLFDSLMGKATPKKTKKTADAVEDSVEKPKAKRKTRKAPIIPDPLPEQTPPLPDSP